MGASAPPMLPRDEKRARRAGFQKSKPRGRRRSRAASSNGERPRRRAAQSSRDRSTTGPQRRFCVRKGSRGAFWRAGKRARSARPGESLRHGRWPLTPAPRRRETTRCWSWRGPSWRRTIARPPRTSGGRRRIRRATLHSLRLVRRPPPPAPAWILARPSLLRRRPIRPPARSTRRARPMRPMRAPGRRSSRRRGCARSRMRGKEPRRKRRSSSRKRKRNGSARKARGLPGGR